MISVPLRNAGFSLVEVMCAILILGIAMVGLTLGITTALSSNKESELQTTAVLLAAGQIELLQADKILTDGVQEGDFGAGLPLYRWKQSISSTAISGLHEVEVTVENAKTGRAIYELRTMLFDPPSELASVKTDNQKDSTKSRKRKRGGQ
ncbi:MAG: prepilin-type N-terminal cleavage/methylation domain-containing protein [Verrucomicrobia bacterium]|nr:prepilin-type N-terminal cleavage/methylation domain-containing protein [Verrucomicrobiota bacterium]